MDELEIMKKKMNEYNKNENEEAECVIVSFS
jgi:hypothetical protein